MAIVKVIIRKVIPKRRIAIPEIQKASISIIPSMIGNISKK
jgi:hypothetical protein